MAIPRVKKEKILEAITQFETVLFPTDEWRDWQNNGAQVWALTYNGKLYPPKKIVSIAAGIPVNDFSGGPETNNYLIDLGFEVLKLHQTTLDAIFIQILKRYDVARKSITFGGNNEIKELFVEARRTLQTSSEVKTFPNIQVVASYGKGNWATIPWISFLDKRETDTTQAGTYVVYLFEEGGNGIYLKLAQGVTQVQKEFGAKAEEILQQRAAEIRVHCSELANHGFDLSARTDLHTDSKLGKLYEASTIAAKHYPQDSMPSQAELFSDLGALLKTYDTYVDQKPGGQPVRDPRPLALVGTWRGVRDVAEKINQEIAENGGWASPWSFPIKDDALPRLIAPFNLYAYVGNGNLAARIRVAEYKASRGNTGMESPWPMLTDENHRAKTRSADDLVFKTWFRIDKLELLDPPEPVASFDAVPGLSTPESMLNQSTFGYIFDREDDTLLEPAPLFPQLSLDWLEKTTNLPLQLLDEMVSSLKGESPQIILAGPPGTGKTWVARQLAHYLAGGREQNIRFVQFHPSYTYESFMEGLRPVTRGGGLAFEVAPGVVLDCVENMEKRGLLNDAHQDYVIVIDEANRANLPKVLGELMFLFEYRQHPVRLQYSGDFKLPGNLRFIATMNTADRSIRSIDIALRRRFDVFELRPNADILGKYFESGRTALPGLVDGFLKLNQMLETELDRHHTIGHTFFMRSKMDSSTLRQIWERRVYPLIDEFFFDQPELAREFTVSRFWPAAHEP